MLTYNTIDNDCTNNSTTTITVLTIPPLPTANALFVCTRSKEACFAVRGTNSILDLVTDLRATPLPFPPPLDDIRRAVGMLPPHSSSSSAAAAAAGDEDEEEGGASSSQNSWDWLELPSVCELSASYQHHHTTSTLLVN